MEFNDDFLAVCGEIFEPSSTDTFIDIIDTVMEFGKKGCNIKVSFCPYFLLYLEDLVYLQTKSGIFSRKF